MTSADFRNVLLDASLVLKETMEAPVDWAPETPLMLGCSRAMGAYRPVTRHTAFSASVLAYCACQASRMAASWVTGWLWYQKIRFPPFIRSSKSS